MLTVRVLGKYQVLSSPNPGINRRSFSTIGIWYGFSLRFEQMEFPQPAWVVLRVNRWINFKQDKSEKISNIVFDSRSLDRASM